MANSIRIGVSVDDRASGPLRDINENWKTAGKAAEGAANDFTAAADKLSQRIVDSGSKMREFRRLGGELGVVGRALGGDFAVATNAIGETVDVLGSAGLAVRGIIRVAPDAISAVAGLGTASQATALQVDALAASETLAGNAATGMAAKMLAAATGVATLFAGVQLSNEIAKGGATNYRDLATEVFKFGGSASGISPDIATFVGGLGDILRGAVAARNEFLASPTYFHQFTTDAKDAGVGLDQIAIKAVAAANGLDTSLTPGLNTASAAAEHLYGLALDLSNALNSVTAGAGAFASGIDRSGGAAGNIDTLSASGNLPSANSLTAAQDAARRAQQAAEEARRKAQQAAEEAARKAAQAAAEAKRKAEQDARELAAAQIAAGNEAFDKLSKAAHDYFDKLHAANLKAIQDAKDKADNDIEQQKRANQQPIDDANKAFKAIKDARELAKLQADVANAQTPEDLAAAQLALSDFIVQQQIDQMQATADAENAKLDIKKKAQDDDFANQQAAENDRYHAQVTAFDESLAELRKYLAKHPAEWAKATQAVIATLKAAGIDYNQAGKDNATSYLAGVASAFALFTGAAGGTSKTDRGLPGAKAYVPGVQNVGKLTEGLGYAGGGTPGDVYLDGEKVGLILDRRSGTLDTIYNPNEAPHGAGTR